jgi:hypothetical protein
MIFIIKKSEFGLISPPHAWLWCCGGWLRLPPACRGQLAPAKLAASHSEEELCPPVRAASFDQPVGPMEATFLPDVAESGNDWRNSAGDFWCSVCRRKRLSAQAFSKSQV